MLFNPRGEFRQQHSHLAAVGVLATELQDEQQLFLYAVEVALLFVVVYRGVVDIRQLVGLYRVGDYRVGNAGLGAIETQIETFEHVLQLVRDAFQQVFVVCKNLVVITIAQNFVTLGNTVTFQMSA